MAEKKPYRVTDAAGPYVAGRKVKPGSILDLSAAQAEYELQRGVIAPHGTVAPLRTPEDGGSVDLVNRGKPGAGVRNRR
ncbi:hypothetical protein [Kaistia sp. UC242_56]|uniref:hypothetical protein n=1 Tax=Kaistia sp. UC242_56 TaxID=3374625 RepID=UPI0037B232C9